MAFRGDLRVARPKPARALAVALLASGAVAWAFASGAFVTPGLLAVLVLFAGMGIASALRRPSHGGRLRAVRADGAGLHVDGALAVARRDLRGALVSASEQDGGAVVHLDVRPAWRACSVFTSTREQADDLVLALGLGHPDDLVRIRALPPWARHLRWLTILLTTSPWFLFNLVRFIPPWGVLVLAGLYGVIALPLVVPQFVEVAADGVLVSWLGSSVFHPFGALERAEASGVGVVLHARSGRAHEIRLTQQDGGRAAERDALVARITAGIARHASGGAGSEEALLARGGRSAAEWLTAMEVVGTGDAGGYRASAVPRERLWEILEDPTVSVSARAGAAMALRAAVEDDADARARLAAVVSRTAAPSLRVTLEALEAQDEGSGERVRVAIEHASALAELEEGGGRERTAEEPRSRRAG